MARNYTEAGYRLGAARLGIDPSEYRARRESGQRWCSYHGAWQPSSEFRIYPNLPTPRRSNCVDAERVLAREYQRRRRAAWKEAAT